MRILIATTQVPFVRGGAELLAENLLTSIEEAGHDVEIVSIPFKWYPPSCILDHMLACRLMKIDEACGLSIDRMIGLKFPAYLMPHPNKVLWLLHQHRSAYDTWDSPVGDLIRTAEGRSVQNAIKVADQNMLAETNRIFTLSQVVSDRLLRFNGTSSEPLHHPPPDAELIMPGPYDDYLLVPSRIDESKRQHLVLQALALTRSRVNLVFMGGGNAPAYETSLSVLCEEAGLKERVRWMGPVSREVKLDLYARCRGVVFIPIDEDYGYVALEAMLAAKPVITCTDSGGPLEFITDQETGLVCAPEPRQLADAMDRITENAHGMAQRLGSAALDAYRARRLSWSGIVDRLLEA